MIKDPPGPDVPVTETSRAKAQRRLRWHKFLLFLQYLCLATAVTLGLAAVVTVLQHAFIAGCSPVISCLGRILVAQTPRAYLLLSAYFFALIGIWSGINAYAQYTKSEIETARTITSVGDTPVFREQQNNLSDAELFEEYRTRSSTTTGFGLPGVPIYFLVPPVPGRTFEVLATRKGDSFNDRLLTEEAVSRGLDWLGFRRWRETDNSKKFYQPNMADGIRCTYAVVNEEGNLELTVARCQQNDYVCTDLSTAFVGNSRLPNMRHLFEGDRWDNYTINLSDLVTASSRYSLRTSVTVLLVTADDYLVLNRRARHAGDSTEKLTASASAFVRWRRDCCWVPLPWVGGLFHPGVSLARAVGNELKIEVGVSTLQSRPQFVGAGFNLAHGRDLSFYAYARSELNSTQLCRVWRTRKHNWKIAASYFIPLRSMAYDPDGDRVSFAPPFAWLWQDCNRHLKAALYSFAKSRSSVS